MRSRRVYSNLMLQTNGPNLYKEELIVEGWMLYGTASKDSHRRKSPFHLDGTRSSFSMKLIGIISVNRLADSKYDSRSPASPPSNNGNLRKHNSFRPSLQPIQQDHRSNPITLCHSTLFSTYRPTTPHPTTPDLRS